MFNNSKRKGYRRSKLEIFIEQQFKQEFPNLIVKYNQRSIIDLELDIFIPAYQLAIEFNGPVHYKPIWGRAKFEKVQQIDLLKVVRCKQKNIELVVFDVSSKNSRGLEFNLNIWTMIKNKLATSPGLEPGTARLTGESSKPIELGGNDLRYYNCSKS